MLYAQTLTPHKHSKIIIYCWLIRKQARHEKFCVLPGKLWSAFFDLIDNNCFAPTGGYLSCLTNRL